MGSRRVAYGIIGACNAQRMVDGWAQEGRAALMSEGQKRWRVRESKASVIVSS